MRSTGFGRLVVSLGGALPYAGIAVSLGAFVLVVALGRPHLGLKGLYIALPIIMASVWLLRCRGRDRVDAPDKAPTVQLSSLRFMQLAALNAVIFITSITVLAVSETRPPGYFVLMAAFSGIVLIQILGTKDQTGWQKGIIIGQLLMMGVNLTWSITLNYPLFIGGTDIPSHLHFIESILGSSRITDAMWRYEEFPLYHIGMASGIHVLGTDLINGYFILAALTYVPAILFAYLVFKAVTGNEWLSLVACFLFSLSGEFLYYGAYMVPRALAFVIFTIILYLLFRRPRTRETVAVLGLCTVTLVMTHQTTLAYVAGILALLVASMWLLSRPGPSPQVRFPAIYLGMLVGGFIVYLVAVARDFLAYIPRLLDLELITTISLRDILAPPTEAGPGAAAGSALSFMSTRADIMLFLFFAWLGLGYMLRRGRARAATTVAAIGTVGLACLVFYIPGPAHMLSGLVHQLLIYRIALPLTIFMSLAMAYGVVMLARELSAAKATRARRAAVPAIMTLLVAFAFSSAAHVNSTYDVPQFRTPDTGERRYYTEAELTAFSFVVDRVPTERPVHSDYLAARYFFPVHPRRVITQPDISYIEGDYVLLRAGELKERWLLFRGEAVGFRSEFYQYTVDPASPDEDILLHLASSDRIYENGENQIYALPVEWNT